MNGAHGFIARYLCIVAMVVTNLVVGLYLLGCVSNTVHVVDPNAEAFQRLLSAELAADARRAAHGMQTWISGRSPNKGGTLDDAKLPEPYNSRV